MEAGPARSAASRACGDGRGFVAKGVGGAGLVRGGPGYVCGQFSWRARGRRPRARAWVRPGPVQEFKDGLYQLYLGAGVPSLDDIAAGVLLDEALAAAPGRDRVNRMLWSPELGLQQDAVAVAGILAAMAGLDPAAAAENARELWVKAAAVRPYGCAVGEADPLALGVRETFVLPSGGRTLPALVPYVRRQHDQAIEAVVGRAVMRPERDGHRPGAAGGGQDPQLLGGSARASRRLAVVAPHESVRRNPDRPGARQHAARGRWCGSTGWSGTWIPCSTATPGRYRPNSGTRCTTPGGLRSW